MGILDYLKKVKEKKETIKKEAYQKTNVSEVYDCENKPLMNALINSKEPFTSLIAKGAEAIGKVLQSEMKTRNSNADISSSMVKNAINRVIKYDDKNDDAVLRTPKECIKVLLATWKYSSSLATALDIKKEQYDAIRKNLNQTYLPMNNNSKLYSTKEME